MRVLLIISLMLLGIISNAQNKKSLLREGNSLYSDSSYNQAEIQYRKSLEKDQDYFNAAFNMADAIYKQERYSESSSLFDALKDNSPRKEDLKNVYHNLGNSLLKEKKPKEAIEAYKEALRIDPNDNETRYNLAIAKEQQQKQEQEEEQQEQEQEQQEQEEEQQEQEEEQQEEEQQEQEEEQQEQKEQKEKEKEKEDMSKEDAEKMLEAIKQQEQNIQEELQRKKIKGKKINILKDW